MAKCLFKTPHADGVDTGELANTSQANQRLLQLLTVTVAQEKLALASLWKDDKNML